MLKALIFDMDGTLAETEELHRQAFNLAFASFELNWYWGKAQYRELLRVPGGSRRLAHFMGQQEKYASLEAVRLPTVAQICDQKAHWFSYLLSKGKMTPRPGILPLVAEAKQAGLKLALVTSAGEKSLGAVLAQLFVDPPFDVIVSGGAVARTKPAPDGYLSALAQLGLGPGDCMAFEDTVEGVKAAKGAGIFTVATPSEYTDQDDFSAADELFADLGQTRLSGLSALHRNAAGRERHSTRRTTLHLPSHPASAAC